MSIVYIENLPQGTKKEVQEAFKPFGKVSWTPLTSKGGYSSGFVELATSQHAAHFAHLIGKLALKRRIIAKTNCKKTSTMESVVSLPLDVVSRRIFNAIEQFKNHGPEAAAPVKLDGTLDEQEIDPELRQAIEADILRFRKYAQSLHRTRRAAACVLVDRVLNIETPETLLQKRELEAQQDQRKWGEIVRFANKCAEEEAKLRLQMKPSNDSPTFYLKFKAVPPNVSKPSFVTRRDIELALEDKLKRDLRHENQKELITKQSSDAASPPVKLEEETHTARDAASPPVKHEEEPHTATVDSLLEEYFGDVDADLKDFIVEFAPRGSEALVEALKELLLEETESFVKKVMRIMEK